MKKKTNDKPEWERDVFSKLVNDARACVFLASNSECGEMAYQLYKKGWCDKFPQKPGWWNKLPREMKNEFFDSVNEEVESKIGAKGVMRHRYKKDFGYTDQEFDDFWDSLVFRQLFKKINNNANYGNNGRQYKKYHF